MYMATYMATGRTGNARTNEPQFTQTSSTFAMTCGAMFAFTRSMLLDFRPIFETYANDFRSNFTTKYGNRGYSYDRYEPAYRYGYTLASDTRYAGKDWSAIEADARRDWEKNHQGSAWEDFKDSIRYAWDRVRGYSASEAAARSSHRTA